MARQRSAAAAPVQNAGDLDGGRVVGLPRGSKVAERIAQRIVRDIAEGRLPPGSTLPAEPTLMSRYVVGRGSLREALRILEVHGVITMRSGPVGGAVVARPSSADYGRMSCIHFSSHNATFSNLAEARLAIEPLMARLAAERSSAEVRRRLSRLLDDSRDAFRSGDEKLYFQVATRFHNLVAQMSGNPVLDLFGGALKDIYTERVTGIIYPPGAREDVLLEHEAIARAIINGNGQRAEKLMREHMLKLTRAARRSHPGLMDQVVDWQ